MLANKKYFQKSKVFLYPLLRFKKGMQYVPEETFISWKNKIDFYECQFLCLYKIKKRASFKIFEIKNLTNHKYFSEVIYFNGYALYIFNLLDFENDFLNFIDGRYSKFSLATKQIISNFFSKKDIPERIKSYLYPDLFHELYANQLKVDKKIIERTYELCDKPNLDLETFEKKNFIINTQKYLNLKTI